MRKDSCFIPDDGYTEQGYIEAVRGLHGEFRFEYRPLLADQRSRILRTMSELKDEKQDVEVAKVLSQRIVSWSIDRQISFDQTRRLLPAVFYKVWGIVLGTSASDLDPQWDNERKAGEVENLVEAAAAEVPVGVARELTAEKNSDAG